MSYSVSPFAGPFGSSHHGHVTIVSQMLAVTKLEYLSLGSATLSGSGAMRQLTFAAHPGPATRLPDPSTVMVSPAWAVGRKAERVAFTIGLRFFDGLPSSLWQRPSISRSTTRLRANSVLCEARGTATSNDTLAESARFSIMEDTVQQAPGSGG